MKKTVLTHAPYRSGILLLMVTFTVACAPRSALFEQIQVGFARDDVRSVMGEPDTIQDFIIPEEPFFGAQESLVNLLEPGAIVEEWLYQGKDEDIFIWFASTGNDPREQWRVIEKGIYPEGAVY